MKEEKNILKRMRKVMFITLIYSVALAFRYTLSMSKYFIFFYPNISKIILFLLIFLVCFFLRLMLDIYTILLFDLLYKPYFSISYEDSRLLIGLHLLMISYISLWLIEIIIPKVITNVSLLLIKLGLSNYVLIKTYLF